MWSLQTDQTDEGEGGQGGEEGGGKGDCSLSETRIEVENPSKNARMGAPNKKKESSNTFDLFIPVIYC